MGLVNPTQPQVFINFGEKMMCGTSLLSYDSDRTDWDFIKSIVMEVKRVLEHIEGNSTQREQPQAIQIQQPEVNFHRAMFSVRQLKISGSHNARYWTFESIYEPPK